MERIILTGAAKGLGAILYKDLSEEHDVLGYDKEVCMDVLYPSHELIDAFKPTILINCAALNDEDDFTRREGNKRMSKACREFVKLIINVEPTDDVKGLCHAIRSSIAAVG